MAGSPFKKIPADSLRYLLVCGVGVILFIAVAVYPTERSLQGLETRINELRYQVEKQKSLFPLYTELKKQLDSCEMPVLSVPKPGSYPRNRIDRISSAFDELLQGTGLFLVGVVPDVQAFTRDTSVLPVRLVMTGSFFEFQRFLTRLSALPAIARIEEVMVKQIPGSREFEVKLHFAIGS